MELLSDLRELLAEFVRAGVEFAVVGGYAVAFHGHPRATKDLDVLVGGGNENLRRVAEALVAFGAPPNVSAAARVMRENEIVWLGQPPTRIDLLRTIDGVATDVVLSSSVTTELAGVRFRVIGLAELITNKRASGPPQDLVDVAELERIARASPSAG